ncbi:hypothetical protein NQ315_001406 [Exocentrus adspersus]|uniref:Uncharacterized protein n=1 Tax=Exocentrus adspersus TaxID=1586481 RepID=A0AAV8WGM1_9CUCU|nr:hypothetical protein NQ315_001406 [Exocentrus adspersus]
METDAIDERRATCTQRSHFCLIIITCPPRIVGIVAVGLAGLRRPVARAPRAAAAWRGPLNRSRIPSDA